MEQTFLVVFLITSLFLLASAVPVPEAENNNEVILHKIVLRKQCLPAGVLEFDHTLFSFLSTIHVDS